MTPTPELRARQTLSNIRCWWGQWDVVCPAPVEALVDRAYFLDNGLWVHHDNLLKIGILQPWNIVGNHGPTAVSGTREDFSPYGVQIIRHADARMEIDFDRYNPRRDMAGAVGHVGEVIHNLVRRRKTNPFTVAKARHYPILTEISHVA